MCLGVFAVTLFCGLAVAASERKPRCNAERRINAPDGSRRRTTPDSDGIVRTAGNNCRFNGIACSLCCDGTCCDDVSDTNAANFTAAHWIPLRFAFVSNSTAAFDQSERNIRDNIRVMNRVFAAMGVWFYQPEPATYHDDPRMVAACDTAACDGFNQGSCDFYSYLMPRVMNDSTRDIPVVVCDNLPYLGEAQTPWTAPENSPLHYNQVDSSTVGIETPGFPTSLGHTLVHEMGHYFGLHHVFDGCNAVGDFVNDTAPAGTAATQDNACDDRLDTCPNMPGLDSLDNYMNYADDPCMTRFTPGQFDRMRQALRKWRPRLLANTAAPTGSCPVAATALSECTCGNGESPATRCRTTSATAASTNGTSTGAPTTTTAASAGAPTTTAAPGGSAAATTTSKGLVVAFVVTLVVCAAGLLAAAALNAARIVLGPTASAVAAASVGVGFVGLAALVFGMRYSDHVANAKAWPAERAFGDAAVFCFWFVLYPVPKNNAIAKAAGSSFERLVPYHVLIALVLYLAMTAHFIGMAVKLETADAIFSASTGHPPLWGFCAWAATTVVVLPSLALRRRFYWVLRLAHLCAPVAILFGVLHYGPLIYALIPPLLAYAVDWALRVRATAAAKPQLVDVRHSAAGGFTQLDVKLAPGARSPGPGAFVLLGLSSVGTRLHPHPFSVAWYDAHARVATLLCKDMGPGTWTGELAAAAARDPTGLLAHTDVQWTGPFGSLQVPLGATRVAVLVAGGIGVTPILNLLRVIRRDAVRRGGHHAITNVVVLWSLRTPELLAATRHKWASVWGDAGDEDDGGESGGRGETAAGVLGVHTPRGGDGAGDAFGALHDSFSSLGPAADDAAGASHLPASKPGLLGPRVYGELFGSALQLAAHDARPFAVVRQRRMDFYTDVPRVLEKAVGKRDAPVTLYCCGPAALMDDAARFARARDGTTYLHTETFEL